MLSRRDALRTLVLLGTAARVTRAQEAAARSPFALTYTSFAVRLLRGRDIMKTDAARLNGEAFFQLCQRFQAAGGQVDLSQLNAGDAASLKALRAWLKRNGLFAELSIPARTLESADAYERAVATAETLGATRLRVAILSGRRYETFTTSAAWEEFATRWKQTLARIKPVVDQHRLQLGIENHKDWTIDDLTQILETLDSPNIGACVDFGNNLAFLENPMELATKLAPWAVTTHLKDMALRRYERGFELSEVPLGAGVLPLADMVAVLHKAKPDLHFCLEMITRDPLKVPYLDDAYWVPFGGRDAERVKAFEGTLLTRASASPLPRISGLSRDEQIAAEDENVRVSERHARSVLRL